MKIIYEPTLSDTALLILENFGEAFIESFWPHPYYHVFCEHSGKRSFRGAIDRLERRKLIAKKRHENGRVAFTLLPKGRELAKRISLKLAMAKNKRWDGRWRLLIFDVEEKRRAKRDFLRKELINFGFYPLQKSVFAYPYPLPREFFEIWRDLNLGNQLIIIDSAKIHNGDILKNFFWPK